MITGHRQMTIYLKTTMLFCCCWMASNHAEYIDNDIIVVVVINQPEKMAAAIQGGSPMAGVGKVNLCSPWAFLAQWLNFSGR